jgi:hypothetical protein
MQVGTQEPWLSQRSQVHADKKRLAGQGAPRCFHAQPIGAAFCAAKSPPDDCRSRKQHH